MFVCLFVLAPNKMDPTIVPFVACGDLSGYDYDSDRTYGLPKDKYVPTAPVQPPINPPYKVALFMRQHNLLAPAEDSAEEKEAK